jgi:hypothetical protein
MVVCFLGVTEVYHWRGRIPLLSRAVLIGLPMTLMSALLMSGHPRLFYWIAIGLFLYFGFVGLAFKPFGCVVGKAQGLLKP